MSGSDVRMERDESYDRRTFHLSTEVAPEVTRIPMADGQTKTAFRSTHQNLSVCQPTRDSEPFVSLGLFTDDIGLYAPYDEEECRHMGRKFFRAAKTLRQIKTGEREI